MLHTNYKALQREVRICESDVLNSVGEVADLRFELEVLLPKEQRNVDYLREEIEKISRLDVFDHSRVFEQPKLERALFILQQLANLEALKPELQDRLQYYRGALTNTALAA